MLLSSAFALSLALAGNSCVAVASEDEKIKSKASIKIIAAVFDMSPDELIASSVMKCDDFVAVVVHRKEDSGAEFVDRRIVHPVIWRENPRRIEINLGS